MVAFPMNISALKYYVCNFSSLLICKCVCAGIICIFKQKPTRAGEITWLVSLAYVQLKKANVPLLS